MAQGGDGKGCSLSCKVLDGGMATELVRMGHEYINDEPLWSSKLLKDDPSGAVATAHMNFLEAGADIIETNTYQASVDHLCNCLHVSEEEAVELLKKGAHVAVDARNRFWEGYILKTEKPDREKPLVAGSIGPYGAVLMDGSEYTGCYIHNVSSEFLINWHRPRLKALVEAGVDLIAMETIPAVAEGLALIEVLKEFPETKAWLSFSCKENGQTRCGDDLSSVIPTVLSSNQIIAVGCNCTAPSHVQDVLRQLQEVREKKSIVVYANSGEEWSQEKRWYGREHCKPLHEFVPDWVNLGANWIGGCCRVYPSDISQIRDALLKYKQ